MLDSGTIHVHDYQYFLMMNKAETFANLIISLREIAASILAQICTQNNEESPSSDHSIVNEIENFLKTRDFEAKKKKIVCANPTLLTLVDKHWEEVS